MFASLHRHSAVPTFFTPSIFVVIYHTKLCLQFTNKRHCCFCESLEISSRDATAIPNIDCVLAHIEKAHLQARLQQKPAPATACSMESSSGQERSKIPGLTHNYQLQMKSQHPTNLYGCPVPPRSIKKRALLYAFSSLTSLHENC